MTCLGSDFLLRRAGEQAARPASRGDRAGAEAPQERATGRPVRHPAARDRCLCMIICSGPARRRRAGMDLEADQQLHPHRDLLELRRPPAACEAPRRRRGSGASCPRARGLRGPPRSARARRGSAGPAAPPAPSRRRSPSRRPLPGACRKSSTTNRTSPSFVLVVGVVVIADWGPAGLPTLPPASWATSSSLAISCSSGLRPCPGCRST